MRILASRSRTRKSISALMLALTLIAEPSPVAIPVCGLITRDPCCSRRVSVLRATIAFSLSSVSQRVESELSCTPSEVMFWWSTCMMMALSMTCLPGTSRSAIIASMLSMNSGGDRTRMDRLWLSGMNRTRPMMLLIGASLVARRPVVHQGRYSPPAVSLRLPAAAFRLAVLPPAPVVVPSSIE